MCGPREAACTSEVWPGETTSTAGGACLGSHWNKKSESLTPKISLQHPLLIKLNLVPANKAKILKGPDPFAQAERVILELTGNKLII